jgi:hypothetical protein
VPPRKECRTAYPYKIIAPRDRASSIVSSSMDTTELEETLPPCHRSLRLCTGRCALEREPDLRVVAGECVGHSHWPSFGNDTWSEGWRPPDAGGFHRLGFPGSKARGCRAVSWFPGAPQTTTAYLGSRQVGIGRRPDLLAMRARCSPMAVPADLLNPDIEPKHSRSRPANRWLRPTSLATVWI